MKPVKNIVLAIGLILILSIAQITLQKRLETYPSVDMESLLYLPSGKYLQAFSLGYQQMLADLLWIKTVSYFGSHYLSDKEYPWLYHILTLIIDLDPRFDFPYLFGGIVLSVEASQAERANIILEKGIAAFPDKWEYPFYIGFNHFYHLGDPNKAIPYIERAGKLPGAPEFVKGLPGTLYLESGDEDAALHFLHTTLENTTDPLVKRKTQLKIEQILSKRISHDAGD